MYEDVESVIDDVRLRGMEVLQQIEVGMAIRSQGDKLAINDGAIGNESSTEAM
jgi:hypothetical protein